MDFDGIDDYVEVLDSASLDTITQNLTISAWVNWRKGGLVHPIVWKDGAFRLQIYGPGAYENRTFFLVQPGSFSRVISNSQISKNEWHHIAVVHDENKKMKVYIDGVLDNNNSLGLSSIGVSSNNLYISHPTWFSNASFDEIKIWNKALTEQEILEEYNRANITSLQQVLNLKAGWNLVSVYPQLADNSVSSVFPGISDIWAFNEITKVPYVPTIIEPKKAYWIGVTEDKIFNLQGSVVIDESISLKAGWNLVSVINDRSLNIPEVSDIWEFNEVSDIYVSVDKANILSKGKGYWVGVTGDVVV